MLLLAFVSLISWATKVATSFIISRAIPEYRRRHDLNSRLFLPVKQKQEEVVRMSKPKILSANEADASAQPLMELASAHFASQALHTFVKLGAPNIIGNGCMNVSRIAEKLASQGDKGMPRLRINRDGLLRIMRLLATVGILYEESIDSVIEGPSFGLTETGALLQTNVPGQQSLAPIILHWMERPLWNAWSELPDYVAGKDVQQGETDKLPFARANGLSSDEYYSNDNAESSLQHANDFVRYISSGEENAVLAGFDWETLSGKTVLDVGGHQGKIMALIAKKYPDIKCMCFDLPDVISTATAPAGVKLVGGDIFDGKLPPSDVIFMKHFLDKCMWSEEQTVQILRSCREALPEDGRIIIAEAVLPDDATNASGTNRLHLFIDVLFLLVGRDAARTEAEWTILAEKSELAIDTITATASPSCYMIVLTKS